LEETFINSFQKALNWGLVNKHQINHNTNPLIDIDTYLNKHIHYELDENKIKAMELFLELIKDIDIQTS
jgi:predicted solute-binding protein